MHAQNLSVNIGTKDQNRLHALYSSKQVGLIGVCRLQKCSRSVVAMPALLPLTRSLRWVAGTPMPSWYAHAFTVCLQGIDIMSRPTCHCARTAWLCVDDILRSLIVARPLLPAVVLTQKYELLGLEPVHDSMHDSRLASRAAVVVAATKHLAWQADGCMCLQSV